MLATAECHWASGVQITWCGLRNNYLLSYSAAHARHTGSTTILCGVLVTRARGDLACCCAGPGWNGTVGNGMSNEPKVPNPGVAGITEQFVLYSENISFYFTDPRDVVG